MLLMQGQSVAAKDDIVLCEMAGDGLTQPAVAILHGRLRYIDCDSGPALMFDRVSAT